MIFINILTSVLYVFWTSGEKHSCECSQGDVAHLQEHQTGEEDGPRQSQEAPEEVPPSHSPVGTVFRMLICSPRVGLTSFTQPEI